MVVVTGSQFEGVESKGRVDGLADISPRKLMYSAIKGIRAEPEGTTVLKSVILPFCQRNGRK